MNPRILMKSTSRNRVRPLFEQVETRARNGTVEIQVESGRIGEPRDGPQARSDRLAFQDAGISEGIEGDGKSKWRAGWEARRFPRPIRRRIRADRPARARPQGPRVHSEGAAAGLTSKGGPTCSSTMALSKVSVGGRDRSSSTIHRSSRASPGRCSAGRSGDRNLRPSPNRSRTGRSPEASKTPRRMPEPAVSVEWPA
jgi:hypothetical protein